MSTSLPFPPSFSSSSFWDYLIGQSSYRIGEESDDDKGNNNNNPPRATTSTNDAAANETTRLLGDSTASDRKQPTAQQPHNFNQIAEEEEEEETIIETPEFIYQCQQKLNIELDRIVSSSSSNNSNNNPPTTKKSIIIYKTAIHHSPDYIRQIQLQILRCERFNIDKSAHRLLDFLEAKLRLFGPGYVGRSIKQSDLHPDDIKALKSGSFQFVSSSSSSSKMMTNTIGNQKTVLCYFPQYNTSYQRIENIIRAWWYLALAKLEDDDQTQQKLLQRRGLSILIFHYTRGNSAVNSSSSWTENDDRLLYWEGLSSLRKLPIRLVTIHFCYNDFLLKQMITLYPYYNYYWNNNNTKPNDGNGHINNEGSNKSDAADDQSQISNSFSNMIPTTATVYFHEGSHTECLYECNKHGIPVGDLPEIEDDATMELDNSFHIEWLRQRQFKEEEEKPPT